MWKVKRGISRIFMGMGLSLDGRKWRMLGNGNVLAKNGDLKGGLGEGRTCRRPRREGDGDVRG